MHFTSCTAHTALLVIRSAFHLHNMPLLNLFLARQRYKSVALLVRFLLEKDKNKRAFHLILLYAPLHVVLLNISYHHNSQKVRVFIYNAAYKRTQNNRACYIKFPPCISIYTPCYYFLSFFHPLTLHCSCFVPITYYLLSAEKK